VHLALLHKDGSNNPLGIDSKGDKIPFYPYFVIKDLFAFFCFLTFFGIFVFYFPNALGHPDNYIPADPMQTPAHIVPEWYKQEVYRTQNKSLFLLNFRNDYYKCNIFSCKSFIFNFLTFFYT